MVKNGVVNIISTVKRKGLVSVLQSPEVIKLLLVWMAEYIEMWHIKKMLCTPLWFAIFLHNLLQIRLENI